MRDVDSMCKTRGREVKNMGSSDTEEKACREKYWNELDEGAKIERMRREVQRAQYEVKGLRRVVNRLLSHVHVDNNIAYLDSYEDNISSSRRDKGDNVHF